MLQLSIQYLIYPQHNVYVAEADGDITFEDLYQHVDEIMSDVNYYTGINAIYDFTKVTTLRGQVEVFQELANEMSDKEIIDKQAKTSIVLNSDYPRVKHMMEGFLLMTSDSQIDYQLFDQEDWQGAMKHVDLATYNDLTSFLKDTNS